MPDTVMPKDYVTVNDLQEFGKDLSRRVVDDITDVLQAYVTHIDERFNKLESQTKQIVFQTGVSTEY